MRRGTALEPQARRAYQRKRGVTVEPAVLRSMQYEWQAASLDGIDQAGRIVVEIKCGERVYEYTREKSRVPPYYYGQLQHILCVTGLEEIDFWVYLPRRPTLLIPTERDEDYIERLIETEEKFWRSLTRGTPLARTRRPSARAQRKSATKARSSSPAKRVESSAPPGQCPDCRGSGLKSETAICERCEGWGEISEAAPPREIPAPIATRSEPTRPPREVIQVREHTVAPASSSKGVPWWVWIVLFMVLTSLPQVFRGLKYLS